MANSDFVPRGVPVGEASPASSRHTITVRITHWLTTICFFALLVTGVEIIISHPRFYWGEEGNMLTPSLFDIPIPASRSGVKTGYSFVLPDQNGWSRYLHFQSAWLLVFTGLLYGVHALRTRHLQKHLLPARGQLSATAIATGISQHLRVASKSVAGTDSYNLLQRLAYLTVIFLLVPVMVWTGLAMSPGLTAGFPFIVDIVGGFQSARTIHFFVTLSLVAFVSIHVLMVALSGFRTRMQAMTTGLSTANKEQS